MTAHVHLAAQEEKRLRGDLQWVGRVPSPGSRGAHLLGQVTRVRERGTRWIGAARACRTAEAASPTAVARWDRLIAQAQQPLPAPLSTRDAVVSAAGVRELLRAVRDSTAGGPPLAEVLDRLTGAIAQGALPVWSHLAPGPIAREFGCPEGRVETALDDLTAQGVLERHGRRLVVAAGVNLLTVQAGYIADRVTARIAAGLHPPASLLPPVSDLARVFVTRTETASAGLRLLAARGTVHTAEVTLDHVHGLRRWRPGRADQGTRPGTQGRGRRAVRFTSQVLCRNGRCRIPD
ncbi:hypothetical protein ACFYT4_16995 [Streptomyces sp. NPDC004609]|uniref:hypothetical protein n=1 Tax=Streptomyces sp. NPDC004609 TaxID=3364704 RepID=UPI0036864706